MKRYLVPPLIAFVFSSGVTAQDIEYETGEYEYAQPAADLDDDVVTQTLLSEEDEHGAVRTIPMRNNAPVFISKPVVQRIANEAEVDAGKVEQSKNYGTPALVYSRGDSLSRPATPSSSEGDQTAPGSRARPEEAPVRYSYPTVNSPYGGHTPAADPSVHPSWVNQPPLSLPPGSRLVEFDRNAWLNECNARLATYDEGDRAEVLSALAGASNGDSFGKGLDFRNDTSADESDHCAAYLDDYLLRASKGQVTFNGNDQYMLVPVTVLVQRQAIYKDGTPVE